MHGVPPTMKLKHSYHFTKLRNESLCLRTCTSQNFSFKRLLFLLASPSHYAMTSAFIHLPTSHHLDLDAKLIEDNFVHPLCLRRVTIFWYLLGKMPSTQKNLECNSRHIKIVPQCYAWFLALGNNFFVHIVAFHFCVENISVNTHI